MAGEKGPKPPKKIINPQGQPPAGKVEVVLSPEQKRENLIEEIRGEIEAGIQNILKSVEDIRQKVSLAKEGKAEFVPSPTAYRGADINIRRTLDIADMPGDEKIKFEADIRSFDLSKPLFREQLRVYAEKIFQSLATRFPEISSAGGVRSKKRREGIAGDRKTQVRQCVYDIFHKEDVGQRLRDLVDFIQKDIKEGHIIFIKKPEADAAEAGISTKNTAEITTEPPMSSGREVRTIFPRAGTVKLPPPEEGEGPFALAEPTAGSPAPEIAPAPEEEKKKRALELIEEEMNNQVRHWSDAIKDIRGKIALVREKKAKFTVAEEKYQGETEKAQNLVAEGNKRGWMFSPEEEKKIEEDLKMLGSYDPQVYGTGERIFGDIDDENPDLNLLNLPESDLKAKIWSQVFLRVQKAFDEKNPVIKNLYDLSLEVFYDRIIFSEIPEGERVQVQAGPEAKAEKRFSPEQQKWVDALARGIKDYRAEVESEIAKAGIVCPPDRMREGLETHVAELFFRYMLVEAGFSANDLPKVTEEVLKGI